MSDQAKNICDQTVFSASGEIKPTKHFNILFVDRANDCVSRMAEAIGNKRYGDGATFMSAGSEPAEKIHPALIDFLDDRGIAIDAQAPRAIENLEDRILPQPADVLEAIQAVMTY